jgi:hypothetical protein
VCRQDHLRAGLDDPAKDTHHVGDAGRVQPVLGLLEEDQLRGRDVRQRREREPVQQALAHLGRGHPRAVDQLDLHDLRVDRLVAEREAPHRRKELPELGFDGVPGLSVAVQDRIEYP